MATSPWPGEVSKNTDWGSQSALTSSLRYGEDVSGGGAGGGGGGSLGPGKVTWQRSGRLHKLFSGERFSEADEVFVEENSGLGPSQGDPVRLGEGAELGPGGWEGGGQAVQRRQAGKPRLHGAQPGLYVSLSPVDGIYNVQWRDK